MRFTFQFLFILLTAYVLELFLPWWSIAIAAFAFGYILRSGVDFLAGFLAIGVLWFTKAFLTDANAAAPLTQKVADIFAVLTMKNKYILFALTTFIGALVGGFATLSGSLLRKKKRDPYY
jgi:hypothetical protein